MKGIRDDRTGDVKVLQVSRQEIIRLVEKACKAREIPLSKGWELEITINDEWMVEMESTPTINKAQ